MDTGTSPNPLGAGVCCNPGEFASVGFSSLQSVVPNGCQTTEGNDPCDCDASIIPSLYTVTGDLYNSGGTPLTGATVVLDNRTAGGHWDATVVGNTYRVEIDPETDVSAGNILRITATNSSEGWTDHKVHECDIAAGGFTADVILDRYELNYSPCYPYYQWEDEDWSGPAVMQACIAHYQADPPTQAILDAEGRANNHPDRGVVDYVDPQGIATTLNSYLQPYHSYTNRALDNYVDAIHRICYWQRLGPGVVPTGTDTYNDYTHWMVVRGIRTSEPPTDYSAPYDYDVYGFYINDPDPIGIGENSYKTATEFGNSYYTPVTDNEVPAWDGKWITVLEPPEDNAQIRLVDAVARFKAISPVLKSKPLIVDGIEGAVELPEVSDDEADKIIRAAIEALNEEIIPYDDEFAEVFVGTVPGAPMLVSDADGDYYLVPFNEPAKKATLAADTLVVVRLDAGDGSFLEVSWVEEAVKYLRVSREEAIKLVYKELGGKPFEKLVSKAISLSKVMKASYELQQVQPEQVSKVTAELVHLDGNLYHPCWKITIDRKVYFVSQDGELRN
jgi:hypothetical protein